MGQTVVPAAGTAKPPLKKAPKCPPMPPEAAPPNWRLRLARLGVLGPAPGVGAGYRCRRFDQYLGPMTDTAPMTDAVIGGPGLPQERRLVTEIPGPKSKALHERKAAAVSDGIGVGLPVYVAAAGGGVILDIDGNSLIDMAAGIAVTSVGNSRAPGGRASVRSRSPSSPTPASWWPRTSLTSRCANCSPSSLPATTRRSPCCSTPAPRRSRTRSRSRARTPAATPSSSSTTPTTAAPT